MLISKKTTWIIVADESAAIVYERKSKRGALTQLFEMTNEAGRKRTGEFLADRGGRSYDSHGPGRHTLAKEKVDPKLHAAQAFARKIAKRIVNAVREGKCQEIALIATPRFLGVLRDALSRSGKIDPALSIDKEMVGKDAAAIQKLLDAHA